MYGVIIYKRMKKNMMQLKPRSIERGRPGFFFLNLFFSHRFKVYGLKGDK